MRRVKSIRKYLILTEQALQAALAYRMRFFISLLSGLVQALVLYYIWQVVYLKHDELNGFTLSQMVTYVFISYAVKNLYSFYTEIGISSKIRDGSVAMELIKPLSYQWARFFESLGPVVIEGILIGLIVLGVGFAFFKIDGPANGVAGGIFLVSLGLSVLVNFCLSYIVGLFSFWTTGMFGLVNSKRFIVDFFSGSLVPLAFFPAWLKNVALALPFHAIVYLPVSIYLGQIEGRQMYYALLTQLMWVVILWTLGHVMWSQASKRVTIHGG
ncbi:MAG: ABC-2 family transporter protein [Anaerolineae bacterium]|nr:ABC-2 family transporter protein [Anaerolineae bacterium]